MDEIRLYQNMGKNANFDYSRMNGSPEVPEPDL